ncbi:MAG: ATP synthase F1 subunit gamma [Deltaproteobacteria bacterium]
MASAREIKLRMKSIKETKKITKAMKLMAAQKLKKSRQQLEQTLPFFNKVQETIADILLRTRDIEVKYFEQRESKPEKKTMYIVIAGDRGLAGGYNSNVLKLAEKTIKDKNDSVILTIGNMTHSYFKRKSYNIFNEYAYPSQNPSVYRAREIGEVVIDEFVNGNIDEVYLVYTQMVSALKLEPQVIKILPLDVDNLKGVDLTTPRRATFLYEPSPNAVFDILVPKYLKGLLYGALVESFTSEMSAKMTAMDSATSNADKMIKKLTLSYNRARQAAITQEISEIVGGAAVL